MNKLCQDCLGKCKQDDKVEILQCKNFRAKPKQLEFSFGLKPKQRNMKNKGSK